MGDSQLTQVVCPFLCHKDLKEFKSHVISFNGLKKGIGQSYDINIARVSKNR